MVFRFKNALLFIFLLQSVFGACAASTSLLHPVHTPEEDEIKQNVSESLSDQTVVIDFANLAQDKSKIALLFPKKFLLRSFKAEIDNNVSVDELCYLLGLSTGGVITEKSFCLGLDRLKRKNVFTQLQCTVHYHQDEIDLTLKAETFWTICSIKVSGVSLGKQSIVQLYRLHVGEKFSAEQHQASLEEIKKDLNAQGYYDADVQPYFEYDSYLKSISINLAIRKGVAYSVKNCFVRIISSHDLEEKKSIEEMVYKKISSNFVSKHYSEAAMTAKVHAVQALLLSQGFVYVDVTTDTAVDQVKKTVSVCFKITFKRSQKFIFMGNRFFAPRDLLETVGQCNSAIGVLPSVVLAEEMAELYRMHGFLNIRINAEEDDRSCYFLIDENLRSKIKDVTIKGSHFTTEKYLIKNFFKSVVNRYLDKKRLQFSLRSCFNWYKKQGFWDIALLKKEYIPLADKKNSYILSCIIDEGKRRIFRGVMIFGLADSHKSEVMKKFQSFTRGMPLTQDAIAEQKLILEQECKKRGYVQHVSITYELLEHEIDDYTKEYDVVWRVAVKKQLHFGKTIFTGPSSAGYKLLSALAPYKEGDVYHKDHITMFYNKLRNAGVYKSIGLQQNFMSDDQDTCDVTVTLEEDDPFEVKVRVGFAQVSKNFAFRKGSSYKLGGSFIWKNPRDKADSVVLDADVTRFARRFSVAYKQPMLFSLPLETVIKGYSNSYMQPVSSGSYKILYEALQHGFLYGVVSKVEHYDVGMSSGFEWMKIKNVAQGLVSALVFTPELVDEKILYLFCEPTLYINYLDSNINPTAGHFTFGSCKVMMPSDERSSAFVKVLFEHGMYTSFRSIIGVARLKMGHIFMQDFASIMPSNRFYLGGANSLRGYQPDKCPPLGSFLDEQGDRQWVAQGGKSMINANLEMRFPFLVQNLHGALFQDFGVLAADAYSLFKSSVPVAATGFGLRYVTPLGPLRFDIGWKWHKQYEEDTSYAWFLTFGYAF